MSPRSLLASLRGTSARSLATVILGLSLAIPASHAGPLENYNIGFFSYAFGGVPENDARAAFKTWVRVIGEESGLNLQSTSLMFHDRAAALSAANAKQIDLLILSSMDYLALAPGLPRGVLMAPTQKSGQGDEYLLISHRDSPGKTLADFRGSSLIRQNNAQAPLADLWLEYIAHQAGLPRPATFFREITTAGKPAKVLLPVYFKQAELCLITETTFQTMCELNPDLARQVRIISRSPRLPSTLIWLALPEGRALNAAAHAAIVNLHETPSGRQTLTLFKFSQVKDCPDSALDSTREFLRHLPPEIAYPQFTSRSPP